MMTAMPIALKILYVLPLFFIRWVQKIVSATNKQSLLCFYFLFCLFCIEIFLKDNTKIRYKHALREIVYKQVV